LIWFWRFKKIAKHLGEAFKLDLIRFDIKKATPRKIYFTNLRNWYKYNASTAL
jgi:uncharacterized UPF0146 family protein